MPEMSPPPPTGTMTVDPAGMSSASSSPTVPCPAMMKGSSKGGTNVAPVAAASARAAAMASSTVAPANRMAAPYPSVASTLGRGAASGMKMTASSPACRAARATPWAWLPAEAATTTVPGSSREIRL